VTLTEKGREKKDVRWMMADGRKMLESLELSKQVCTFAETELLKYLIIA
jgi:hypothetical protein